MEAKTKQEVSISWILERMKRQHSAYGRGLLTEKEFEAETQELLGLLMIKLDEYEEGGHNGA